jgi:ectoine hydroxylase-related dioxygenase (phytanoyl-CoA dioxygenase family)
MHMHNVQKHQQELAVHGFSVVDALYSEAEVAGIVAAIQKADSSKDTFRKSADLFAIRQFLKEVPETFELLFTDRLKALIRQLLGKDFFVVKSIYFDKPETSNWYVPYHQDLTISVDKKVVHEGFSFWTTKQNQFAVQPPLEILENITTIRIHLDETNEDNGALRVVPGSHLKKLYRPEKIDWSLETERVCSVPKGGVMLMKPLLLHCSGKTTNSRKRRVIHLELSDKELPADLKWAEQKALD